MEKRKKGIIIIATIVIVIVGIVLIGLMNSSTTIKEDIYSVKAAAQNYDATSGDEITPNGNEEWLKEQTVQFNIDSGEYGWLAENEVVVGEYNNFVKGDTVAINKKTGKYRLNVRYTDAGGQNINFLSNPFNLDNSVTSAGTIKLTRGNANGGEYGTKEVTDTDGNIYYEGGYTDDNIYIKKIDGTDDESGHKSTVYSVYKVLDNNTEIVIGNSSIEDTIIETNGDYKIVVTTTDNLGNTANRTYVVHKGISNSNVITIGTNGNSDYEISVSTTVTVNEGINAKIDLYYAWAKVGETPTSYSKVPSNGIVSLSGVSGEYELYIKTVDEYGNVTITKSNVFHLAGKITNVGTMIFKYNDENGEDYTPNTYTNQNIYLKIGNHGSDGHGGNVVSTYKITKKGTTGQEIVIGEYTNESTVLTNEGEYTVTITSKSDLGASTSEVYYVKIDKVPPTINFIGVDDYNLTGKIGVTIKDEGLAVSGVNTKKLRYYWTRNYKKPTVDDFYGTTEGGYRGALTSTSTMISGPAGESGIWCLWILAEDNAGNYTIANSIVIENNGNISYMDNTAPLAGTMEFKENDENGNLLEENTYTAQNVYVKLLSGYDADSGVKSNTYNITKNGNTYKTGMSGDITLTEHGQYVFTITTVDNQDNKSTRECKINIDKQGPDVTFIPNGQTEYVKQQEIEVKVDEINQSGVEDSKTSYKWIGYNPSKRKDIEEVLEKINEIAGQDDESKYTKELEEAGIYVKNATITDGKIVTPTGVTGIYHLYVYAEDKIGNKTIKISEGYKLDNTNPTKPEVKAFKGNEAYYGEISNKDVTVVASGSESLSGVDKYQYSISEDNGQTWSEWKDAVDGKVTITEDSAIMIKFKAIAELKDGVLESEESDKVIVRIDRLGPTAKFANYETAENGTTTYVKNVLVRITVIDQNNTTINANTLKYEWVKFASVSEYNTFNQQTNDINTLKAKMSSKAINFANGEEIPSQEEANGIYALFVYAQDSIGNESVSYSNIYRLGEENNTNGEYEIAGEYVKRVLPETKVEQFITKIKNIVTGTKYTVYDKTGKEITSNEIVTTGATVTIDDKTYKIAVIGDLNGDGSLDIVDVSRMINHISGITILENEYKVAGDINNDEITDLVDLSRIMQIVVGLIKL